MFKRRIFLVVLLLIGLLALAGCEHSHKSTVRATPAPSQSEKACPPDHAYMGCATPRPTGIAPLALAPPRGLLFPDVYEGQGAVNWAAVAAWQRAKGWHPAAIFKLGEFRLDHQVARNAQQTAALGFWHAGYWFVRNTGCAHEAALIVSAARQFGLKIVILDDEVPEARGYAFCLAPPLKAAGFVVVEYTAPGTNPDGRNPGLSIWAASFGASHVPCVFTCLVGQLDRQSILAWQFTDGQFGPPVAIRGLGRGDVSVDFGITRLGEHKPPPAKWSTAQIQLHGRNGTVVAHEHNGHWTVGPGQRVRSQPFNAKPLGK